MRYAILSDIHSNLEALKAVLEDVERRGGVEGVWCLGDLVGYGPDPNECIQILRRNLLLCIVGNHDLAALGKLDLAYFNPDAATACRWTMRELTPENRSFLEGLPQTLTHGDLTLAHGSPRDPIWEYLLSPNAALESFFHFQTAHCLVGHSHIPLVFRKGGSGCRAEEFSLEVPLSLGQERLIVNPGSVGQPRDGDPRASYALYDAEAGVLYHYRVAYDIATTQRRMLKLGLPSRLAERLSYGW